MITITVMNGKILLNAISVTRMETLPNYIGGSFGFMRNKNEKPEE